MKMTKTRKISKLVMSGVISSFLLTVGVNAIASPLSLIKVEQGSVKSSSHSMWSKISDNFTVDTKAENNQEVSKQITNREKHSENSREILNNAASSIATAYAMRKLDAEDSNPEGTQIEPSTVLVPLDMDMSEPEQPVSA